mgnify:FL=1
MEDSYDIFYDHMKTLTSFLKANGYVNTNPDYNDLDQEEFFDQLKNTFTSNAELVEVMGDIKDYRLLMSGIFNHSTSDKRIFVYFCSTLGDNMTSRVQEFLRILCNVNNCKNGIIITDRDLSPGAKKELNNVKDYNCPDSYDVYNIKIFTDKTFIDIVNNNYVPKILKIYTTEEAKKFCEENRIKENKLMKIIVDDPLCSFHMVKIGNISELERETGIESDILRTQRIFRYVTGIPFQRKMSRR